MKKFWKRLSAAFIALLMVSVLAFSFTASAAQTAFGPDRTTRTWTTQENGFPYVTFDSYTGVPNGIGDEEQFFQGVQVGRDSSWSNPVSSVTSGAEVEGHIYIHNNADPDLNTAPGTPGIAHNVTVSVNIPTASATTQDLKATISASNANPESIFDTLEVNSASNFALTYEPGTAQMFDHNTNTTTTLTTDQANALFSTTGWNMGDQNGCFQFLREITFKMKVATPNYTLVKQVRLPGQGPNDWKQSIDATDGETLEWSIKFNNTGTSQLNDVAIVDNIPAGLTVVPNSITVFTPGFPNGTKDISPNPIQANGKQLNIDIGNFAPLTQDEINAGDVSGQVIFDTTLSVANLNCGANTVTNQAFATPQGLGTITSSAAANVTKTCATPTTPTTPATPAAATTTTTTLPNTGAGSVIGLFSGVTIAGGLLHRFVLSRRFGRGL